MKERKMRVNPDELEIQRIRTLIEKAVLQSGDLGEDVEVEADSYLKLIATAKVATDESNRLLQQSVTQARRVGHSWATIGKQLSISRQAAQQRFGHDEAGIIEGPEHQRVIKGANAFNEMQLLQVEGAAGYHLVSFGPFYLVVKSSDCRWEHTRLTALRLIQAHRQLEGDGWSYVGSWFPFHYFKRPLD